jgi:hypothetical protein
MREVYLLVFTSIYKETKMAKNPNKVGQLAINELREFAGFTPREQRYIRCSLDIALGRQNMQGIFEHWVRDATEESQIRAQNKLYAEKIPLLRSLIPTKTDDTEIGQFMGELTRVSGYDLGREYISSFPAYRYLYERILSAKVRPWLPSAFCAAAALPHIKPPNRKKLLHSISEAAATAPGWSPVEPHFFPEWIEKVGA